MLDTAGNNLYSKFIGGSSQRASHYAFSTLCPLNTYIHRFNQLSSPHNIDVLQHLY